MSNLRRVSWVACALGPLILSARAAALDGSGGVGLGGTLAGAKPRLAVSPHVSISWRRDSGFLLSAHVDGRRARPAIATISIRIA